MSVTLTNLLSELPETTRNSTTGSLDNTKRTRAINRILQELQNEGDWEFTKRSKTFYFIDGVHEYSLENYVGATMQDNDGSTTIADFKNPRDLRIVDTAHKPFEFREEKEVRSNIRRNRTRNQYAVDQDVLIINYFRQTSAQLHNCDSLTNNGTITASGDASNLTIDDVIFDEGSGALNFDVSSGTSMIITFDGFDSKDLETLQNKSHLTVKAWLPTITNFTSIKLEWGDDSSNNWSKTETAPAGGQSLEAGKELLFAFRWADADENGSPDATDVKWARVTLSYSSAITDTDFRLDDLRVGKEVEMTLDYFSQAMVKDTAGDYQLEFDAGAVTGTDELLGGVTARRTVVAGATYEIYKIIGGKSERDRTDNKNEYDVLKVKLLKKAGYPVRRATRVLNFPGFHGRVNRDK